MISIESETAYLDPRWAGSRPQECNKKLFIQLPGSYEGDKFDMSVTLLPHTVAPTHNSSLNRSVPVPSSDIRLTQADLIAGQFDDNEKIYNYSLDLGKQNTNTRIKVHIQLNVDSLSEIEYKAMGHDGKLDVISMNTLSNNSNTNFHRLTVVEHE